MITDEIIKLLSEFVPFEEDDPIYDNESYFYELMDELRTNADFELAIEPIFRMMEKFPSTELGHPGPIVHALESFEGYFEDYLFESLNRKPTFLTIWILNRLINAEQNSIIKQNLVERLRSLAHHPLIDENTLDSLTDFIDFQNKNK